MASDNAKAVAQEVIEKVINGERVILKDIIKNHGYADSVADSPQRVTDTTTYQEEIKPLADRLKDEIDRIQLEMSKRDISQEQYRILSEVLDKYIKNYQLLSGGVTETHKLTITFDEAFKERK